MTKLGQGVAEVREHPTKDDVFMSLNLPRMMSPFCGYTSVAFFLGGGQGHVAAPHRC